VIPAYARPMTERRERKPTALTRLSIARTAIVVVVIGLALLAFTPVFGPFRFFFRGILVLGILALVGSYLWPWIVKIAKRWMQP
jgi:hypothetical protein